jgi:hypothetical protein
MLTKAIQSHAARLKRGLGLLLVVFIFYGTTVEAAHRHGSILASPSDAAVLNNSDQTATPLGGKVGCSDCLICQLHQGFNTTLIAFRIAAPASRPRIKPATELPRDVLSQVTGPIAGRAPPSIS